MKEKLMKELEERGFSYKEKLNNVYGLCDLMQKRTRDKEGLFDLFVNVFICTEDSKEILASVWQKSLMNGDERCWTVESAYPLSEGIELDPYLEGKPGCIHFSLGTPISTVLAEVKSQTLTAMRKEYDSRVMKLNELV